MAGNGPAGAQLRLGRLMVCRPAAPRALRASGRGGICAEAPHATRMCV